MESTGKYLIPVFNILEERGIHVVIANSKWVKAVKGNKDDTKDSKWIGDLFRLGIVPGSFIPPKNIRVLRKFTRYRYKLVSMKSSEKNRFQNAFTVCNIALDSVVSDKFGSSASAITDYIILSDSFNPDYCRREHLSAIDHSIAIIDNAIFQMASEYKFLISLLSTIPGIDRNSAINIIPEIDTDVDVFGSHKRLCRGAGLTPGNNESAGKKKSVRISRAGVYLKPALVQVAHTAVKSTASPYYRLKYEQLSKRSGKKRAIIAIARMILSAVFSILKTGEVWNPTDLFIVDLPEHLKELQRVKAIKQALKFLQSQGVLSS